MRQDDAEREYFGAPRRNARDRRKAPLSAEAVRGIKRKQSRHAKHGRHRPIATGDVRRVAGTTAGVSLIASALCYLLGPLVRSHVQGDGYSLLADVSTHLGAWWVSHALLFAGSLLLVPAVLALVYLLADRGGASGLVGGALALFGILANVVTTTIGLVVGQMSQVEDRAAMEALLYRVDAIYVPFYTLTDFLWLGMLVLVAALYRRGAAPGWPVVLLAIGTALSFFPLLYSWSLFFSVVAVTWLGFALLSGRRPAPQRVKGDPQNVRSKTLPARRVPRRQSRTLRQA
jgi:hypothetical protein